MKDRIKKVMKRVFNLQEIPDDISQSNCAEWDSMNHLNLVVELEEEFDVSFEPEDIAEMKSLKRIEIKLNNDN
ncbi:MAG: acyl carrier protein [Holosporales bacterium]|jgi:acyl carrier protein|nr:acyl carrier protein [Holosporales bacterium]